MLQVLCVPGIGDDYAGRSIQVNEEWDPEGSEFLSQVLFPKLFLMGEEISWPGSEWECAEEQGAYYLLWTPSLRLTHWIMPCRRRERFIRSRHPLKSNRGVIPISMHAWMGVMDCPLLCPLCIEHIYLRKSSQRGTSSSSLPLKGSLPRNSTS